MPIYLDYNATTPTDPRVLNEMQPWLSAKFGNSASRDHAWGWDAKEIVEVARRQITDIVNLQNAQATFTSGATESINTVLRSFAGYRDWNRKKIVTCATEHDAVLAPCRWLSQQLKIELEVLPVNSRGHIDLESLQAAVSTDKKVLVVIMAANNEIGTIQPIRSIGKIARNANALFLCDMAQSVGRAAIDLVADEIDFAAFSAHKIYGPKGIGVLLARDGESAITMEPLILGGGQERGLRGGTLNVPAIVGFGEACRIALMEMNEEVPRIRTLRDHLENGILSQVADMWINGDRTDRICNTTNIGFRGVDARALIRDMHDVAVSTRAACSTGEIGPSHVLKAIGLADEEAYACIRFSLGRFSTEEEIDYAIDKVVSSVHKLRRQK